METDLPSMHFFQNKAKEILFFTEQKIKTGTFSKKQAIERSEAAAVISFPTPHPLSRCLVAMQLWRDRYF